MSFGSDFSAIEDLDPLLTFLVGESDERRALAQAVARRLLTPRGGLFYDQAYGFDLRSLTAGATSSQTAAAFISAEVRKEERVRDCATTITETGPFAARRWVIQINATTTTGQAFTLTLAVSAVSVEVLSLEA